MKQLSYLFIGAAAMMLASCSQEEIFIEKEDSVKAIFSVNVPDNFITRSVADGSTASQLYVAAYDAETSALQIFPEPGEIGVDGATVELNLVSGKSYTIIFFAASAQAMEEGVYVLNQTDGSLSVQYSNMTSEGNLADAYDCFYSKFNIGKVNGAITPQSITLSRPVAQVNWGTNDLADVVDTFGADGAYIQTKLVANLYTNMNLLNGDVSDNQEVTLPPFAIAQNEEYPTESGYAYLAYQYVLASSIPQNIDLKLLVSNAGNVALPQYQEATINLDQVSVQANYQTNVYGSLLKGQSTKTVDRDDWLGIQYLVWDGKTKTTPAIDTKAKTVTITTPEELAGFADYVNQGLFGNSLSGYTVTLENDMDMGGYEYPMIGEAYRNALKSVSGKTFQGVFDGQNHYIKNLKVTGTKKTIIFGQVTQAPSAAFLTGLEGNKAEFKNVNFVNVEIDGLTNSNEQAAVVGLVIGGATVSNVTVLSGKVFSDEGAAGIVGRILNSGNVDNCVNYADISITTQNAGGIVGVAYEAKSPGMNISDCTNYGTITGSNTVNTNKVIGGIVGLSAANVSKCVNNGQVGDNLVTQYVGGIVGYSNSCGSIKNCINNGNVKGNSMVAGILAFAGGIGYTLQEVIEISGNINNGALESNGQGGGILCQNSWTLNVFGNTNNAPYIQAKAQAAGIDSQALINANKPQGSNGYVNYGPGNINKTPIDKITGSQVNLNYIGTIMIDNVVYTNGNLPDGY